MKKFHLTDHYALINFDASACDSEVKIVSSKPFETVLTQFVKRLRKDKHPLMTVLKGIRTTMILDAYRHLLIWNYDDVLKRNPGLVVLLRQRDAFYRFTESFYDYWRRIERFGVMAGHKAHAGQKAPDLIQTSDAFNSRVLYLYRTITQNILGHDFQVYRQLPAGVNANLILVPHRWSYAEDYASLQGVGFITHALTRPPFLIYSKSNTRSGLFTEIKENPMRTLAINKLHYIAYPVKIGPLLAFVYIHRDFLHHGIALANLFEPETYDNIKNRKPDLIYVYGIREDKYDCTWHHDTQEDVYVGFVSRKDQNDYFGYLKKMLLTLHNVYMIDKGRLPIHGAMVSVLLKNDETKNIVVIGDSGAGKSETLEALRLIGREYIKEMRIIFDDMGTFYYKGKQVVANGTEIGAFVRLDDLDAGYAYQEMDRAVFMNTDQINARVVLPVTLYDFIMKDHKVDLLLYANNYEETEAGVRFFEDIDEALKVFRKGQRFAKGTTSEEGLVKSYFANPFGPIQRKAQTEPLLEDYFKALYQQKTPVGELYTRLAVPGFEMDGPKHAARKLLALLTETPK
ncbi:MAG: phosphoenolpyruvate carboxykinase [Acholeplasmataceae bacterium]|nr:MAG: phosphoenolpyruvate carboxykinase [Acholeplasmataceae bacterium]